MAADEEIPARDHVREPFFWLFVVLAVVVAVLAFTNRRTDSATAGFFDDEVVTAETSPDEPVLLPTPTPTTVPENAPAVVEVTYSAEAVTISGVAPATEVVDALTAAAAELVAPEQIASDVIVDTESSFVGGLLILMGQVDDDAERARVVDAFDDLGFRVDDRLVPAGSNLSVAEVLRADPELSQIADFLAAAGILDTLGDPVEGGITVFAPTNAAVEGLDSAALDELGDAEELAGVLRYHLVDGRVTVADLASVTALSSRQGESIAVGDIDGAPSVAGAMIVNPDIDATNGIVHVVDAMLLPGTLRTEVALNELVTLEPVLFARGSADILDESFAILDRAAQVLRDNPLGRVEVQGHTDTDGPAEINLELSQQRADSVRDYLVAQGIDAARLTAQGFGETEPKIDPEESDEDRAANRRIEFRVS